jgi:hypothetical protein
VSSNVVPQSGRPRRLLCANLRTPNRQLWSSMLLVTTALFVGVAPGTASAAVPTGTPPKTVLASNGLPKIVLSKTLWGLVESPPGWANGPFLLSDLKHLPGYFPGERTLAGEIATGQATAYFRSWSSTGPKGDDVVILAFEFHNASLASGFQSVETSSLRSRELDEFLVPGMPDNNGFQYLRGQFGAPATIYVVDLNVGLFVFDIGVVNGLGDLSTADAANLATQQASRVT